MSRAADLRSFVKMVEDFSRMGTGAFKRQYPDYEVPEGVNYIARKARALLPPTTAGKG